MILIAGLRLQIGTHLSVFSVIDVLQAGIEFILNALVVLRAILTCQGCSLVAHLRHTLADVEFVHVDHVGLAQ